jgi:hypothetical protein
MPGPSESCRRVAAAIERYLASHPGAADSEQGIAAWWLPEMSIDAALKEVRDALEFLVDNGTVEMQVMLDGHKLYRARRGAPGRTPD